MAQVRSVLRYFGGKNRIAPWIVSHFPKHGIYVEPYCGAASVLMAKPRVAAELINDQDGEITSLFRVLRDPAQARELDRLLRLTPYSRSEFEAAFLDHGDPIEQARRTLIKSFMGFGADALAGIWHTGFRDSLTRSGLSNCIPAQDWARYPERVPAFTDRLRGVVIETRPALDIIRKKNTAATLLYVDPPYPPEARVGWAKRKRSYRFEMTPKDHRALAKVLHGFRGMVVLSGYHCPLYAELYPDWESVERETHADGARDRTEVLWFNKAALQAQPQLRLL